MASAEPEVTVLRPGKTPSPVSGHAPAQLSAIDDATAGLRPDLGTLSYDELLRHTVETARDVVTADAAYALVADEDGELRVRAAAGMGVSESLFAPSVPAVFADGAAAKSLVTVPFLVDGRVTGVLGRRHLGRPVRRQRRGQAAAGRRPGGHLAGAGPAQRA